MLGCVLTQPICLLVSTDIFWSRCPMGLGSCLSQGFGSPILQNNSPRCHVPNWGVSASAGPPKFCRRWASPPIYSIMNCNHFWLQQHFWALGVRQRAKKFVRNLCFRQHFYGDTRVTSVCIQRRISQTDIL